VLIHGPIFAREDFHFCEAVEAGVFDELENARCCIDAFSRKAAVEERVVEVWFEFADMEGEEMVVFGAGNDFGFEVGFPPDVEGIDGDADKGVIDALAEDIGIAEGGYCRAVCGVHGMKRLDG